MTFIYRDPAGDRIEIEAVTGNCLSLDTYEKGGGWTTIHLPFEDIEQFIAGIRAEASRDPART